MKDEKAGWLLNLPNTVSEGIALLTQCREHMPPEDQQVIDGRDRVLDIEDVHA